MIQFFKQKIKLFFFSQYELFLKRKALNKKEELISQFNKIGIEFRPSNDYFIHNPKYIKIGSKFRFKDRFRMEAIDNYKNQLFTPSIVIGDNVAFNSDIHIGCINNIEIGDNCLFASRIFITDHNHGDSTIEMLKIIPEQRPLISKGPVIIKNNVWVGEGAAILPGVVIGENSIVSTNAVVTKDVPPNVVVGGVPAKIIKIIE